MHRALLGILLSLCAALPASAEEVQTAPVDREVLPEFVRDRFEQALRHRMPWPEQNVTLENWNLPNAFIVPSELGRLRLLFRDGEDFLGRVSAQLEFSNSSDTGTKSIRRGVSADVVVRIAVVVTSSALRRGTSLGVPELRHETRDLRQLPRDVITNAESVYGLRLARSLPEGHALTHSHLVAEPLIRRGDTVRVDALGSGLELMIEARALEGGGLGQRIRLENPGTRKRFHAEITGPGQARLTRPGSAPAAVGAR